MGSNLHDDGFTEDLAHRGMGEDHLCHVVAVELAGNGDGHAEDHFRAGIADDGGADKDLVGIKDHLDESVAALVFGDVTSGELQGQFHRNRIPLPWGPRG